MRQALSFVAHQNAAGLGRRLKADMIWGHAPASGQKGPCGRKFKAPGDKKASPMSDRVSSRAAVRFYALYKRPVLDDNDIDE